MMVIICLFFRLSSLKRTRFLIQTLKLITQGGLLKERFSSKKLLWKMGHLYFCAKQVQQTHVSLCCKMSVKGYQDFIYKLLHCFTYKYNAYMNIFSSKVFQNLKTKVNPCIINIVKCKSENHQQKVYYNKLGSLEAALVRKRLRPRL